MDDKELIAELMEALQAAAVVFDAYHGSLDGQITDAELASLHNATADKVNAALATHVGRRMSIITDEMVEAAADAIGAAWDTDEDDDERLRVYARAALAAVAPRIAEAEREACIDVARRWSKDGQSATAHGIIIGIEELPAIRARQEPTPSAPA